MIDDQGLYSFQQAILALALLAAATIMILRGLQRTRPALAIGVPLAVAAGLRVAGAIAVSSSPDAATFRGPDEFTWSARAREVGEESLVGSASLEALFGEMHVWLISLLYRTFGEPSDFAIRFLQIMLAVAAVAVIAAAIHDLVGASAAVLFAWIVAFEPSNVFFSGTILREPLLFLGEALVVLGCVKVWRAPNAGAAALILAGVLVSMGARSYAGWFLLLAASLVVFHSLIRRHGRDWRLTLIAAIPVLTVAVLVFGSWSPAEGRARIADAQSQTALAANLSLEPVDASSWSSITSAVPRRIRDVLLRPYPWQLSNSSQRLGAVGTMAAWLLIITIVALATQGRRLFISGPPLLYPLISLAVAYALATANAGTGFRYRAHLLLLAVALFCVLLRGDRLPRRRALSPLGVMTSGEVPITKAS